MSRPSADRNEEEQAAAAALGRHFEPDGSYKALRELAAREAQTSSPNVSPAVAGRSAPDAVNHPAHYTFGKYEVIDVLLDWFAHDPLLWQVGKYIARAAHKGSMLQDLKKARFYLDKRIELIEKDLL